MAQLVKNRLQCRRPGFDPWVGKIPWRRERLPTPACWPGELYDLFSPWGQARLTDFHFHFLGTKKIGQRSLVCCSTGVAMSWT